MLKTQVCLLPRVAALGRILAAGDRASDGPAAFPDAGKMSRRNRLHHDVSERRCLHGPGDDRAFAGIRCPLAKERVLATPSHHSDHGRRTSGDAAQLIQNRAVTAGRGSQDRCAPTRRPFPAWAGRCCGSNSGLLPACWREARKAGVVRVQDRAERLGCLCQATSARPSLCCWPSASPLAMTLLQKPEARNVFQQKDGAIHAALVGIVQRECLFCRDWGICFHAHQAPRSTAEEYAVNVEIGNGCYGAGGVVRGSCNDREGGRRIPQRRQT